MNNFLFLLLLILDQVSKYIFAHLRPEILSQNTGIAFGLFNESTYLIILFNCLLLLALFFFRKQIFGNSSWQKLAFVFIMAGGLGNLLDRVLLGYVRDFLNLLTIPTFNLADVFINIGIALLLFSLFFPKKEVSQ